MELPKSEGENFETTPAGTFIGRCYRFIDLGSHEQSFQGESKGLKRLVLVGFELPTELLTKGDNAGRPFTIHKRYTWSTHEKANMRKDLESWRGRKFNDSDFGPGGFNVKNLLGVPCTLTIVHSEKDGSIFANVASIGTAMKGMPIPDQINPSVYLTLEPQGFDREVYGSLSEKLQKFIAESPEYRTLVGGKQQSYADQKSSSSYHAPLDRDQQIEAAGHRDFAPVDDFGDDDIPF